MSDRLQQLLGTVQRALAQPSANPQVTALVVGVLVIVALLIVVIIFSFLTPKTRRVVKRIYFEPGAEPPEIAEPAPSEAPAPARKPSRSAPAWLLSPVVAFVLVVAALVAGYAATSTNDYCARSCHRSSRDVLIAEKVVHADCVDCHAAPGIAGLPGNVADRLRMAFVRARGGTPDNARAIVAPASCLACHADIAKGVAVRASANVRMRHVEPLAAGMSCQNCHGPVGHLERRQHVSMSRCVTCHDSVRASADCNSCHTTDVGSTAGRASSKSVGSGKYSFPPVVISDTGCGACHDQKRQCDTCHGLRMPHSQVFISGYHARDAAFEKKQLCWRCHVEGDCGRCHVVPFASGHAPGWKEAHRRSRSTDTCTCHARGRKLAPGQLCGYCHGPVPSG